MSYYTYEDTYEEGDILNDKIKFIDWLNGMSFGLKISDFDDSEVDLIIKSTDKAMYELGNVDENGMIDKNIMDFFERYIIGFMRELMKNDKENDK